MITAKDKYKNKGYLKISDYGKEGVKILIQRMNENYGSGYGLGDLTVEDLLCTMPSTQPKEEQLAKAERIVLCMNWHDELINLIIQLQRQVKKARTELKKKNVDCEFVDTMILGDMQNSIDYLLKGTEK